MGATVADVTCIIVVHIELMLLSSLKLGSYLYSHLQFSSLNKFVGHDDSAFLILLWVRFFTMYKFERDH